MSKKHIYEVVVSNVGTFNYTNKKLATKEYNQYAAISKTGKTRAGNESVTLIKDGQIVKEYTPNLIANMFDLKIVKEHIKKCPKNEVIILCGNWSINKPKYSDENTDQEDWDWNEFEDQLGHTLQVNDYDDLVVDVHGILSN